MREQLIILLKRLREGDISFSDFLLEMEILNQNGIWKSISGNDKKKFHEFFKDYVSMFDPGVPRSTWERFLRWWDNVVDEKEIRDKAIELEKQLTNTTKRSDR